MYTPSGIHNLLGNVMKEQKVKTYFSLQNSYQERLSEYFAINFYYQSFIKTFKIQ